MTNGLDSGALTNHRIITNKMQSPSPVNNFVIILSSKTENDKIEIPGKVKWGIFRDILYSIEIFCRFKIIPKPNGQDWKPSWFCLRLLS